MASYQFNSSGLVKLNTVIASPGSNAALVLSTVEFTPTYKLPPNNVDAIYGLGDGVSSSSNAPDVAVGILYCNTSSFKSSASIWNEK